MNEKLIVFANDESDLLKGLYNKVVGFSGNKQDALDFAKRKMYGGVELYLRNEKRYVPLYNIKEK